MQCGSDRTCVYSGTISGVRWGWRSNQPYGSGNSAWIPFYRSAGRETAVLVGYTNGRAWHWLQAVDGRNGLSRPHCDITLVWDECWEGRWKFERGFKMLVLRFIHEWKCYYIESTVFNQRITDPFIHNSFNGLKNKNMKVYNHLIVGKMMMSWNTNANVLIRITNC